MKRFAIESGSSATLALLAVCMCSSELAIGQSSRTSAGYFPGGTVSGTVVDSEGVPQMGALVQLLLPDTSLVVTALTDMHGHYRLSDLKPGSYRVRVSAALFLPVIRQRLQVAAGSSAIANMTLSTVLASAQWLPATRRTSSDADEDWMWTLRSSSMRPVLRLDEEASEGTPVSVSSSASESRTLRSQGRLTVEDNEGGFARGGTHNILSLERRGSDGSVSLVRADLSGPRTPFPVGPSADLTVGWERSLALGGTTRSSLTYTSHPEVLSASGANGMQTAVFRNAQRMELGDRVRVDAGSVMRDVNLGGNTVAVEPFLKVAVNPSNGVVIAYTFTASRGTESLDDLDRIQPPVPVAMVRNGDLRLERGHHQAVSLAGKTFHGGLVEVAVYRDQLLNSALSGSGVLSAPDAGSVASLSDPTTQTFIVGVRDYGSTGVRLLVRQPISDSFAITGVLASGRALSSSVGPQANLSEMVGSLEEQNSLTATLGADFHSVRTGTKFHAGYRWQPASSLTPVDGFHASNESAYVHCRLRQSLHSIPLLPEGLEAVVDVQNLLEEGYRPLLSQDGRVLYLTQAPRVLQAGLSFSF